MNDEDLRTAMRATMTITPPPPMASGAALAAGRRAVRRRAAWTGAGLTAVLVAATSVAATSVAARNGAGGAKSHPNEGAPVAARAATPSANPAPPASKPTWPTDGNGQPQQDATARSGARYEQGVKLLDAVTKIVPAGWSQPTGQTTDGIPLQDHQAQVEGDNSGKTWGYLASVAVRKDGRTGRLLAEVHTPGNGLPTDPCRLARSFWSMTGQCQVVTVGTTKVGVVVKPSGDDRIDQWAAYRWPDGTVVFTAQSRNATNGAGELPALTTLPLTVQQLAATALDPSFHLS